MTGATKKYKAEAESATQAKNLAEHELKQIKDKEAEEKKKRWSAIVYCENCMEVSAVNIPPTDRVGNQVLRDGDCVVCRYRGGLRLVRKVNFGRSL